MSFNSETISYQTRIIAFVDILGFKKIIKDSEQDASKLNFIYKALEFLRDSKNVDSWGLKVIEIEEDAQKRGVQNFDISASVRVSCFSDTIVVSAEVTDDNVNEVFSTLVANLSVIGAALLDENILIRGAMTIGNLYHGDNEIIMGQALIEAYELENTVAKYPRIIISNKLISKLNFPLLSKKDRYPYHQYLERFDDGCVGFHQIIYYQVLQTWEKLKNEKFNERLGLIRETIISGLDGGYEHPDIYNKYVWLKEAFNRLIILEPAQKRPIAEVKDNPRSGNIHHLS
jgi:hypothetical protein